MEKIVEDGKHYPPQLNAIDMYPRTLVLHLIEDNNDWKISCSGIIINLGKQV